MIPKEEALDNKSPRRSPEQKSSDGSSAKQKTQQFLEFDRMATLRIVEHIELPKLNTVVRKRPRKERNRPERVRGDRCAQVLAAIEGFCGKNKTAIVGINNIATRAKVSPDTAERAILVLEALYLLEVTHRYCRRGRLSSQYRPIWSNVLDYVPEEHWPEKFSPAKPHSESAKPHSESAKPHSAVTTLIPMCNPQNTHVASGKLGGWQGGISPHEFESLDAAIPRFSEAVANGFLSNHDRLRFLTLWAYIGRQSSITNPGGFLTKCLTTENGWRGSEADETAAREWLSRFDAAAEPNELTAALDASFAAEIPEGIE